MPDDEDIVTVEEFDKAWVDGEPVDTVTTNYPLPPENGWLPKDFPHLTIDHIPYSTNAMPRADPFMTITPEGWLFIEAGNIRMALPDLEEWQKFVYMVTCLWNSYALAQQQAATPDEGEQSDERPADERGRGGQAALPDHDQPEPRGGAEAVFPADPESG